MIDKNRSAFVNFLSMLGSFLAQVNPNDLIEIARLLRRQQGCKHGMVEVLKKKISLSWSNGTMIKVNARCLYCGTWLVKLPKGKRVN